MTDVARLAGVSHQTVSRVLNDPDSVKGQTRARVVAAIEKLDYHPNYAARTLVTGWSKTLGVVALDSTLYGPSSTLYGIESAARESEYGINIVSLRVPNRRSTTRAVERLRGQGVDGIVVIAPYDEAIRALEYVPRQLPVVATQGTPGASVPGASVDQYDGARLAVVHLLELGHRTVYHLAGPGEWFEARERERGWLDTLHDAGASIPPVLRGDWSPRAGYELGRKLSKAKDVTAVFVANDEMALGVLRAFSEAELRVPGDVSIVGFDDAPVAEFFSPPLTTVRQDFIELGRRAVSLVLARINGRPSEALPSVRPELIVRKSTGVPKG
jgi:DNA-binding LacI/PurR family transcriptional regulator